MMKYNKEMLSEKLDSNNIVHFFYPYEENGVFSPWHKYEFREDNNVFLYLYQHTLYWKAILFEDRETATKIKDATLPYIIKNLGRNIKNFDQQKWDEHKYEVIKTGCLLKFSRVEYAHDKLIETGNKIIVGVNPYDRVLCTGIGECDPDILYPRMWPGENLLGFALMEVRDAIK